MAGSLIYYDSMPEISGLFTLLFVLYTCYKVGLYFKLETVHGNKAVFIFAAVFLALLTFIHWPGFVSTDDLFLLKELSKGRPSAWHSFSYSTITSGLLYLGGQPFLQSIFNFILFLQGLGVLLSVTKWHWKTVSLWLLLIVLSFPQTAQLVLLQNRDATYSLLLMLFIFHLIAVKYTRMPKLRPRAWELILLAVILGDLRQEGKIIVLLAPFLLYLFFRPRIHYLFFYFIGCIGLSVLLQWSVSTLYPGFSPYAPAYKVTAFLNPISYIINRIGVDSLTPETRADIDRVVTLDSITKFPNPYDIDAFHNGGLRFPIAPEQFAKFQAASLQIIWQHWDLYLENRWLILKRLFLLEPQTGLAADALRDLPNTSILETLEKLKATGKSPNYTPAQQVTLRWMDFITGGLPLPLHILLSSCLGSILALLFLVLNTKRNPYFASLAALILVRSFVVLALAPAAYFKYVSSTWVIGLLLTLVYWNIRSQNRDLVQAHKTI